ncbi:MAG: histone deacetylase [Gemmatimonadetes bacterium]|nr:histone deacetylase [Gemmatimonadota bacterium]
MTTRREFISSASKGLLGLGVVPGGKRPATPTFAATPATTPEETPMAAETSTSTPQAMGTGLIYDARYLDHVLPLRRGEVHPERPLRLVRIMEVFAERGLDQELIPLSLLADPMTSIRAHHTREHVESVRRIDVTGPVAELAVAGALGAVDAVARGQVKNAFCASRPPGHHANNTGQEEGFCFYSNAAIATRYAQRVHGFERVLIIDWDYHHGNGTQNAFYDDASVLFFSTHDWQAYPGTGDPSLMGEGEGTGFNINAHLDCGSRDVDMLRHWDSKLLSVVSDFRPDFIIVSAGFDSRRDDLLGCFDLTDDVFKRMTRTAMDLAEEYTGGRLVSLLEGGYNVEGSALAAAAHVETLLD